METPLPQSTDAEKGLLGSILLSPTKTLEGCISLKVSEAFFFSPHHRRIYTTLLEMRKEGRPIDLISLTQYLEDKKHLEEVGGAATITDLFTFVPTASNYAYYCQILQEKAAHRSAILETREIEAKLLNEATSTQEIYDIIGNPYQEAKELCSSQETKDYDHEQLLAFMDKMEKACLKEGSLGLMPFGITGLDVGSGGAMRGEVVVVHGATSTGKSLTGKKFIQHAVFDRGERAAIFSLEMLHEQCLRRFVADIGSISLSSMRLGKFTNQEFKSFSTTMARISQAPIHIYDVRRNEMTLESIERELRKLKKNKGLDMAMIDYLQLIKPSKRKAKTETRRDQDLQMMAMTFKLLAQELDIAVILVAQANENGTVFDSSQVESAADWILGMVPTSKMEGKVRRITGTDGLWVSKAREAERGRKIPIRMVGKYARIEEDLSDSHRPEPAF